MRVILFVLVVMLTSSCSYQGQSAQNYEAIPNTKKLFKKGHSDLYKHGAFTIPNTSISLIPAGPSAFEVSQQLIGINARQSLFDSINKAKESIQVISIGSEKTYQFSKSIHQGGQDIADLITQHSRPGGMLLMNRSAEDAQHIIGRSWQLSKDSAGYLIETSEGITDGSINMASNLSKSGEKTSAAIFSGAASAAAQVSSKMLELSGQAFSYAGQEFIKGYAALPKNLSNRAENMQVKPAWHHYAKSAKKTNEWRSQASGDMTFFIKDATEN